MLGYYIQGFILKSEQASARVQGLKSSQKRKRLSGRLETKMVVSSASGLGGRRENWKEVSLGRNSALFQVFFCLFLGEELNYDQVFVVPGREEVGTADFYFQGDPKAELIASLKGWSIGIAGVVVLYSNLSEINISMGHLVVGGPSHRLSVYLQAV